MIDISAERAADSCSQRRQSSIMKGDEVQPGFLSILDPTDAKITPLPNSTGRRTALAAWLTDPKNPLVARVMVNRIWHYNFGTRHRGDAGRFRPHGHRVRRIPNCWIIWPRRSSRTAGASRKSSAMILLSNTYQQSSDFQTKAAEADPDNKLLWR